MTARFILSLDCEGKWGVADHVGAFERASLTDARLRDAYGAILRVLDEYEVQATFAFVGCFAARPDELRHPILRQLAGKAPDFLGPALASHASNEGWHGAWAVDAVQQCKIRHEVALHGTTHIPWSRLDREGAELEFALLESFDSPVKHARTFIYPRNDVAHVDVLVQHGLEGYRRAPVERDKLGALFSELNIWTPAEPDQPRGTDDIMEIPAGFFVNWQHGPRRLVPREISAIRARRMIEKANGEVVHFWLHPENVASAPATLGHFTDIIEAVAAARDAGRCDVLTQLEYCRSRHQLSAVD